MESNDLIGYVIVGAVVIVLICFQLKYFFANWKLIKEVQNLFPVSRQLFVSQTSMAMKDGNSEVESDKDGIKISQIVSVDNCKDRETFQNILCSINNYLYKNKGAASDFMLIRDIVERNCDSKEEEINTQTPIPLYIGLMGTMTGIIIGIGRTAVLGGGFSTFINNPEQAIGELMGGVAIAMIASLDGIILTTVSSLMSKTSKSKLEAGKNEFYSWIQAQLLPVLSGNMVNTLQLLQQNLSSFNDSFSSNIGRMENALKDMSGSFDDQLKILELLKNLDIKRMATANVTVLQQFEKSTANFQQFVSYISQTSTYLQAVKQLNDKVGEYVSQTSALTNLSNYFQEENDYFQSRRSEVNQAVVKVDDILKKSFRALQDNAEQEINSLTQFLTEQQDKFKAQLQNVDEQNQQWLTEQRQIMAQRIESQEEAFKEKAIQLGVVIDEIKEFAAIKASIVNIEHLLEMRRDDRTDDDLMKQQYTMMQKQNDRIDQLCRAIENMASVGSPSTYEEPLKLVKKNKLKTVAWGILGIMLFLASVLFIIGSILFITYGLKA